MSGHPFSGSGPRWPAKRICVCSQTFNLVIEPLGLRNGMVSAFVLPVAWTESRWGRTLRSFDGLLAELGL